MVGTMHVTRRHSGIHSTNINCNVASLGLGLSVQLCIHHSPLSCWLHEKALLRENHPPEPP